MKYTQLITAVLFTALLFSCAKSQYKSGVVACDNYRYTDAINYLEKSVSKKPTPEAQLLLAESYLKVNRFSEAKTMFDIANLNPGIDDDARLHYGQVLMSNKRYSDAETVFEGILSRNSANKLASDLLASCKGVDAMLRDSALFDIDMVSLNGVGSAYSPVVSGGKLYVAAPAAKGLNDPYTNKPYTDLFVADAEGDGWGRMQPVSDVDGKYHEASAAFSADGNTMVYTASLTNERGGLGKDGEDTNNMQLYVTRKGSEGNWNAPERLSINEDGYMYAHPALSADGNTVYFSSDRQGGMGGMDLYKSTYDGKAWGLPENLGGAINTPGNEVFPTLKNADTLYFSSNAHQTLGGLDLMYSARQGSSWNTPKHLSAPINSAADDFGITFDGVHNGLFSSDRSGTDQVYTFVEHDPEITVNGLITDKNTMMPLKGISIVVKNDTDGTEEVITTDATGSFNLNLDPGKEYTISAEHPDYFNVSEKISTVGVTSTTEQDLVLELEPLVVVDPETGLATGEGSGSGTGSGSGSGSGSGIGSGSGTGSGTASGHNPSGVGQYPIPNIYWDYNSWAIRANAEPYLNQLVKVLKDNPSLTVQIQSHCDCRGSNGFNDALSQKRADAVVDYLVSKGIPRAKLQSRGKGKRSLLNNCNCRKTECSDAKHGENRRTEFIVVAK